MSLDQAEMKNSSWRSPSLRPLPWRRCCCRPWGCSALHPVMAQLECGGHPLPHHPNACSCGGYRWLSRRSLPPLETRWEPSCRASTGWRGCQRRTPQSSGRGTAENWKSSALPPGFGQGRAAGGSSAEEKLHPQWKHAARGPDGLLQVGVDQVEGPGSPAAEQCQRPKTRACLHHCSCRRPPHPRP